MATTVARLILCQPVVDVIEYFDHVPIHFKSIGNVHLIGHQHAPNALGNGCFTVAGRAKKKNGTTRVDCRPDLIKGLFSEDQM